MPVPPHARFQTAGAFVDYLEEGQFSTDLMTKIEELLAVMAEKADETKSRKATGSIQISLKFDQEDNRVHIAADIKDKPPQLTRRNSMLFVTEEHELSLQHPTQHDMFDGPRDVAHAER